MEQFVNWRSIKIFLLVILFNTCVMAQDDNVIRSGYYFVIQITDVSGDTIRFETVEIYRTAPNLEITLLNDTILSVNPITIMFRERSFDTGILRGVKKRHIGKLLVLNTTIDKIDKTGIIEFKHPRKPKQIRIEKMFKVK